MRRCENCGWLSVNPSGALFCGYSDERTWKNESCMAWKDKDEPHTNEDRLNAMTTEEKAEFLATTQMNILFLVLKPLGIKPVIDKDMVVAECLDWLKQED